MYETLNKINGVVDVKKMDLQELNALAEDIREALFNIFYLWYLQELR